MMLSVSGLAVAYGRIEPVKGIDLCVASGDLVCLIGANGAGKSTTLKAIAGLLPVARGDIHFDGMRLNAVPAHARVARGIALVPEGRGIFSRLSVEENLLVGATVRRDKAGIRADLARGYELFPRLAERRTQAAGTLSGGEQQMLAIARALMSRPRLLLLDEPSMGLAPIMVQRIFETIRTIARDGVTLLLVEQNARAALAVSDRGYVMEGGRVVLAEPAAALLDNPAVQRAYLGG